ncbi:MAG: phenylalanine--tRNA ligase subunit beta [Pseudohongiellaceae bacterium]
MIFSRNWLREWVPFTDSDAELIEKLTMAGLEVDGVSPVARTLKGIVVATVTEVQPHPDAEKLSLCTVDAGGDSCRVVCGAPNVRQGMKVPFATLGAEIQTPGEDKPFKIKKAKLRGVESEGMLCSAEELGLEEKSAGLLELPADAPVGADVCDYLGLNDVSIELDLTPNRGDCLGIAGIAREVGVLTGEAVTAAEFTPVASSIEDEFPVRISAPDGCPRYLGRVVRGVDLEAETPLWMKEKLRRCGLRSIDPIVDVTNYVLLELGQPMHAFDLAKLSGHIDVRMARGGERLTLLDGKEVTLTEDILVIADADKAVAMAGIMGGLDTAVTEATADVFLECAFFAPLTISGKARAHGLHTDASHRYERGVDYTLQGKALERATALLLEIAGGRAGPVVEATGTLPEAPRVRLELANVPRLLGVEIAAREIEAIFARLGLRLESSDASAITVRVPAHRFDLAIEADLIEELARIYGYNNIPSTHGLDSSRLGAHSESRLGLGRLRALLTDHGYQEVITYSFIDPALARTLADGENVAISLQNPLSEELSLMRTSLLPGLVSTLRYNQNRQQERVRLFECGQVYRQDGEDIVQENRLAGLLQGARQPENWAGDGEPVDFYDVKATVEALLGQGRRRGQFRFAPAAQLPFHPGRCARISSDDGRLVGHVGALHPAIQRQLGLSGDAYLFELRQEALLEARIPQAAPLSKHPEVSRDLAIIVGEEVLAGDILALVRAHAGEYLTSLRIFDVYQGDAVAKNEKSLALGLTWQHPSRTLSDQEIIAIIGSCINALQEQFNANLRN